MLLSLVFVHIIFAVLHTFWLWYINSRTGESQRVLTTVFAGDLRASIWCRTLVMVQRKQQSMCVQMGSRKCLFTMLRWSMLNSIYVHSLTLHFELLSVFMQALRLNYSSHIFFVFLWLRILDLRYVCLRGASSSFPLC